MDNNSSVDGTNNGRYFSIAPGQTVKYGCWVYLVTSGGSTGNQFCGLAFADSSHTDIAYPNTDVAVGTVGQWVHLWGSSVAPANTAYFAFGENQKNQTVNTTVRFDDGYAYIDPTPGVQASSRGDTLSDSRPSATSNHTFAFTTNSAILGSDQLTLTFPAGFTLPGSLNCGDVDAATSSNFNFNYPACAATATAWGFSVSGTNSLVLRAPDGLDVHVATSTPLTIWIGSSATSQQQGIHWITNPSTAGIYTISVGGTFGGSGNMLVSINSGVTVQATVAESLALTVSSVKAVNCTADDGATVTAIDTSPTTVSFGIVPLNTFYIGCQDLVVSTNAGNGYSITTQESYAMKTADGRFTIPDATCDAGTCTESAAAAWATATHNGFGHTCFNQDGNHDCDSSYTNGTKFRQFANIAAGETAQAIMSSTTPATVTARIKHRLSVGASQVAGTYTTLITYTIFGTF